MSVVGTVINIAVLVLMFVAASRAADREDWPKLALWLTAWTVFTGVVVALRIGGAS